MNKKKLYGIITFVFVTLMSVSLTSCSDDDPKLKDAIKPDPSNPALTGAHDPDLIGTWEYIVDADSWGRKITINYRSDGRYYETEEYWEMNDGKIEYDDPYWESGYWSTDNNYIYAYCTNSCDDGEIGDSGSDYYCIVDGVLYIDYHAYKRK